jgi:hypothetical protein
VINLKKTLTAILAVGVLVTSMVPAVATAATTQNHAKVSNTTSSASSYRISNILPEGTNTWGSSGLRTDRSTEEFVYTLTPVDSSKSYVYDVVIEIYTSGTNRSYVGSVGDSGSGTGVVVGRIPFPSLYPGTYYTVLYGSWSASDGSSGSLPTASTNAQIGI